ncbi:MAG TPA: PsiF family protein [Beijerinckiaceae bacterium]|nr:PsiF family protein [Beijerinckiaceae bacterium]
MSVIALGAFVLAAPVGMAGGAFAASHKMAAHHASAMAKPRSAASVACSKKADAMKVHGKKRKSFMSTCKKKAEK